MRSAILLKVCWHIWHQDISSRYQHLVLEVVRWDLYRSDMFILRGLWTPTTPQTHWFTQPSSIWCKRNPDQIIFFHSCGLILIPMCSLYPLLAVNRVSMDILTSLWLHRVIHCVFPSEPWLQQLKLQNSSDGSSCISASLTSSVTLFQIDLQVLRTGNALSCNFGDVLTQSVYQNNLASVIVA